MEIGANTTIDRGSLGDTRIGAGTKIDNLVHLAHNVRISLADAACRPAGHSLPPRWSRGCRPCTVSRISTALGGFESGHKCGQSSSPSSATFMHPPDQIRSSHAAWIRTAGPASSEALCRPECSCSGHRMWYCSVHASKCFPWWKIGLPLVTATDEHGRVTMADRTKDGVAGLLDHRFRGVRKRVDRSNRVLMAVLLAPGGVVGVQRLVDPRSEHGLPGAPPTRSSPMTWMPSYR